MVRVSKKVREKILKDKKMSSEGALILGIKQNSFELLARRNSDKLGHKLLYDMYVKYGIKESEIFTNK